MLKTNKEKVVKGSVVGKIRPMSAAAGALRRTASPSLPQA